MAAIKKVVHKLSLRDNDMVYIWEGETLRVKGGFVKIVKWRDTKKEPPQIRVMLGNQCPFFQAQIGRMYNEIGKVGFRRYHSTRISGTSWISSPHNSDDSGRDMG